MTAPASTPRPDLDELAARVFHGLADDEEHTTLARLLAESADARERFADHATVQAFLTEEAKAGSFADDRASFFAAMEEPPPAPVIARRRLWLWVPAIAAAVIGLLSILPLVLPGRASAALDQVIAALDREVDRSYRIRVLDEGDGRQGGQPSEQADRGRFPPAAFLDGSRLHVRGSKQFVLEQTLPGNVTRTMGSDGQTSWSIRGAGPVRVSADPFHFGAGVVGGRQEIPFLELRSQLSDLRTFYQLELFDPPTTANSSASLRGLRGLRKSSSQGGPKEVEIWFDPTSGLIHRMILGGLPRGNNGPARLALELESTSPLGAEFFTHQAHHGPDARIEPEPL